MIDRWRQFDSVGLPFVDAFSLPRLALTWRVCCWPQWTAYTARHGVAGPKVGFSIDRTAGSLLGDASNFGNRSQHVPRPQGSGCLWGL
jgi:hypothetical protein